MFKRHPTNIGRLAQEAWVKKAKAQGGHKDERAHPKGNSQWTSLKPCNQTGPQIIKKIDTYAHTMSNGELESMLEKVKLCMPS